MSGLVAIVAHGGERIEPGELERLAATYEGLRGESDSRRFEIDDRVGLVRFTREGADASAGIELDDRSWAAFVGVPLHPAGVLTAPLEEIDGAFALVRYAADSGDVTVASDPFGMQTLYAAREGGKTYVATSALALAKHLHAVASPLGVATFLHLGLNFGPETHWNGIRRLEPATELRLSRDGEESRRYWRPSLDRDVTRLSLAETTAHCVETLIRTLGKRRDGDAGAWADLTGGFDTRLMALGLQRAGIAFEANTVGQQDDLDVQIAERVATRAGWSWSRFSVPGDWEAMLPDRLASAVAWGDGLLNAVQLSEVLWHHEQQAQRHPSLFIGGGGEHFRNFAWQQEFLRGGRSRAVNWDNWLGMRLLTPVDPTVFAVDLRGEVRADLRSRMEEWIEPYADERNTVKLDMLYAYKSTGHFGAYRSAAAAFLDAELPFYLKPIFVAATSSNFRLRNHHRLARHMMAALDPRIAELATTTGGPAEPWRLRTFHRFSPYYAGIARRAVNKLSQRSIGRPLLRSGGRGTPRSPGARLAAFGQLERSGGARYGDLRLAPLLHRGGFEDLVGRLPQATTPDAALLDRIVTAELALRMSDAALGD